MKENLILEDRNYISAKRASEIFSYTSDYIGQLCRAGKLECKMIGRSWFITKESLIKYRSLISETLITDSEIGTIDGIPKIISYVKSEITPEKDIKKNIVISKKLTLSSVFFIISMFFLLQSIYINTDLASNLSNSILNNPTIASLYDLSASTIKNISGSVSNFSNKIVKNISENISNYSASVFLNTKDIVKKFNGFVIARSSNSLTEDEITKNNIRNSFSDEVQIKPDITGTSGVITPVFKTSNGDDFLYVLVPVKNLKKNTN